MVKLMVPCWRRRARDGHRAPDQHSALANMYNYINFVCLSSLSASSSCSRAWWFCTTWVTSFRELLRLWKTAKHRADHVLNFSRLFIFRFLSSTKKVFDFTDTVGIVMKQSENYILNNKHTAEGYWLEKVRDLEICTRDRALWGQFSSRRLLGVDRKYVSRVVCFNIMLFYF